MNTLIINPFVIEYDANGRPDRNITQFSNAEWGKIIHEIVECVKVYEDSYGIKVENVTKLNSNFIEITLEIVDNVKFSNYDDAGNVGDTLTSFLNWDLVHGEYPSFYKNNKKGNKAVNKFVNINLY